ncbi:MAG: Txe/YoeB family addiction module toxin [Oscillospiraceae bacterium]
MYKIVFTKTAVKDIEKLKAARLNEKAKRLLDIIRQDPYTNPPPCEKLLGDLKGAYSRRLNLQHRLIYEVFEEDKTIKIIRMWTHYE